MEKKRKLKFPDTAFLLMVIIFIAALLTYIVPAGEFDRITDEETGRTLVQAGTYHLTQGNPTSLVELMSSVFRGLVRASEIVAFVFVVGGSFGIVSRTGAIAAGISALIKKLHGSESILIALIMTVFAICGATFGMAEESLPFVVILVVAALKMGYDPIVGVSMVVVGIYCGYSPGPLNPFNTGIAQGIAELPTFSGIGLRLLLMVGALIIAIFFTIRHGHKYKKENNDNDAILATYEIPEERDLNKTDILVLLTLAATIIGLIFGVVKYGWYFIEISALFFGMGILVGFIYHKTNLEKIALDFVAGACEMTTAAIFIGLSRAILVILEDGIIMDSIVYYLSLPLGKLNNVFGAWGIYISQGLINIFIPSSTGQAVVVMPILSPLSDVINVSRQTAVLAYQAGDGFWNMITPTHSVLMASLGLAKVPFGKWFKFAFPLVLAWTIWVFVVLAIAVIIGYGPF
ncbi:MAG: TIGR00366 family protein [Tissierellia bacterium]|nr:TIGR00366 family protein [Tissierellia bacterium]